MRCRDELIEMLLNRIRRMHIAAKERLAQLREQHQATGEALLATLGQILYAVHEPQSDAALGQQIKQVLHDQGGVDHLSPLGFKHVNMLDRYTFTLPDIVAHGELRPLREPNAVGIDDA